AGGALVELGARRSKSSGDGTPAVGLGRVVVVPLRNITGDTTLNVVGFMAGDWLTEGLQRTGLLEVIPAIGVPPMDTTAGQVAVARWAEETSAGTVVSGFYYGRGDRIVFRVQVADQGGRRVVGTVTDVVATRADPVRGIEELRNRLMGLLALQYDERL